MTNAVATVNSEETPNFCTLDDMEAVYKGVHEVYSVDENGTAMETIETYLQESYLAYYYCNGCSQDWVINVVQDQDKAWELAKAHLVE